MTSEALVTWINAGPGQWQSDTQFAAGQCILDPDGYLQAVASITGMGRTGLSAPAWSTSTVQPTLDGQVVWARIDPQPWAPNQVYSVGQFVLDSNSNVQRVISTSVGASAGKAPAWNSTIGQTTIDGQVTWINSGPGTWQPNTVYAAGQYILDANGNLQTVISVTGTGMTGALQPTWPTAAGQTQADGNLTWLCCGPQQSGLFYCSSNNTLQLRSVRAGTPFLENFGQATSLVNTTPMTLDQYGNYARWDPTSGLVMAGGSGPSDAPPPNEVVIYAPGNTEVTDLAMGYDGVLYLAIGGSLVMIDRRNRWPNFTLTVPDFNFWRLAALPEAGVLALDHSGSQLGKVAGQPLQTGPVDTPDPGILRPCQANQDPPRIVARFALPAAETYVAIAPMESLATAVAVRCAFLGCQQRNQSDRQHPHPFRRSVRDHSGIRPVSARRRVLSLHDCVAWGPEVCRLRDQCRSQRRHSARVACHFRPDRCRWQHHVDVDGPAYARADRVGPVEVAGRDELPRRPADSRLQGQCRIGHLHHQRGTRLQPGRRRRNAHSGR